MRKELNYQSGISSIWAIIVILAAITALLFAFSRTQTDVTSVQTSKSETTQETKSSDSTSTNRAHSRGEEGLIGYWSFDEGEGSTLGDSSGNRLDGEINRATWVEGVKGKALEFDGDGFVEINTKGRNVVGGLKYGTVSLWFKYKNLGSTGILPMLYLGEANDKGTTSNLVIEIGHGHPSDKQLYYTFYNNSYEPVLCFDSNQNLKENTWYHFAVVNRPSGNTGYLNGVELTNRDYNFSNSADTRFFSTLSTKEIFRLGYGWFGIDQKFHYFSGALDDLRIYNRPLTNEEIAELANQ